MECNMAQRLLACCWHLPCLASLQGKCGKIRFPKMKTQFPDASKVNRDWLMVDATNKSLGRLASQVARYLCGKHKANFAPHTDTGDFVIVVNAAKVLLTGNKEQDKVYYRHTGYPGGIKQTTAAEMRKKHPERLVEKAVKGMLPKGPLGNKVFTKLKVYAGPDHIHEAQQPRLVDETKRAH